MQLVRLSLLLSAVVLTASVRADVPVREKVDFDRDVRPILAENCFACHGFDANKRQAGLRLDIPAGAAKRLESGHVAVVPKDLAASELVKRVSDGSMPPASTRKKLTPRQVATLRAWVEQGGRYSPH